MTRPQTVYQRSGTHSTSRCVLTPEPWHQHTVKAAVLGLGCVQASS